MPMTLDFNLILTILGVVVGLVGAGWVAAWWVNEQFEKRSAMMTDQIANLAGAFDGKINRASEASEKRAGELRDDVCKDLHEIRDDVKTMRDENREDAKYLRDRIDHLVGAAITAPSSGPRRGK